MRQRPGWKPLAKLPAGERCVGICSYKGALFAATDAGVYVVQRCWWWPWRYRLVRVRFIGDV